MGTIRRSYNTENDIDSLFLALEADLDAVNIKPNSVTSALIADGTIVNADVSASAAVNMTKTDINSALHREAIYRQDLTTSSLTTNQVIYYGWSYMVGTGGPDTVNKTITLPNGGYDNANYAIFCHPVGTKAGSNPTSPSDVSSLTNNVTMHNPGNAGPSSTAFTTKMADTDGAAMSANNRFVFHWMTIGTKA